VVNFYVIWNDSEESKTCLKEIRRKVKFKWVDAENKDTDFFFELHILVDELTKDVSLLVVDFAEKDEINEASQLWENQISDLKHLIGSV
jgi:hypothetical protein